MPADAASTSKTTDSLPASKDKSAVESKGKTPRGDAPKELQVVLEHGRSKHLGWTAFGLIVGVALLIKLGTIGQGLGVILIATALYQGYKAALTFMHPPGTFKIGPDEIVVPTGLCRGRDLNLQPGQFAQLQHAVLLSRAVPWTMAGPLLVVESGGKAYAFPRDWFASESDQRRIERALNSGRLSESE